MADEEELETTPFAAASAVPAAFDESDNTADIPHPKRFVFVMPSGKRLRDVLLESTITTIKHPRHGSQQMVFVNPEGQIFEVQEHHRKFGSTWLIGEAVEPRSPLYVVTPYDLTFIAIYILRGGITGTVNSEVPNGAPIQKFMDSHTLLGMDPHIAILPPVCHAAIINAFESVADTASENDNDAKGDKIFFRFSEEKCIRWLKNKYEKVLGALQRGSVAEGLKLGAESTPTVSEQLTNSPLPLSSSSTSPFASLGIPQSMMPEKVVQLIAEYLDRINEPLLCKATGVDLASLRAEAINNRKTNNAAAMASRATVGAETVGIDDLTGEPAEKKKRVEIKSASVKKLEKAGAPKGTPSLMSLFAKKAPPPAPKKEGE